MKVDILSREYPPKVYGGAGVHAEELSKVLAERVDVTVRAFDGPRAENEIPEIPGDNPKGSLKVVGYDVPKELQEANGALKTFGVDLQIADDVDADIIHAHTWYACLAGYLAKMLHGTPLVITAHSLEPFRPWKREQLGGGYDLSSWAERDAYEHADRVIAVSAGMREDILSAYPNLDPDKVVVVHNGITMSQFETPSDDDPGWKVFERYNIDRNKPTLLFVGRITRQKGLPYLLQALHFVDPGIQIVLCAGAPDTPEIMNEVKTAFAKLDEERGNIIWIEEMLPKPELNALEHGCDAFPKSSSMSKPDISCLSTSCMTAPAPRPIQTSSCMTWPTPSTASWPILKRRSRWDRPVTSVRATTSAGSRSPTRPSRSMKTCLPSRAKPPNNQFTT